MPYYFYQIDTQKNLTCLGSHNGYRDAKVEVKQLRKANSDPDTSYRIIYAQSENEAELLLKTPRKEPIRGED
ncbi:MAG: hypothetical protein ABW168_14975 [Sedimenticola sp.]